VTKETLGSSPVARRGTTSLASIDAKSSQHGSANDPSVPSPTPRKTSSPEVQLLSYFCEIMSAARYRDWTSGAIISDMNFNLVTCDREGAIKSAPTSLGTADGVDIFSRWVLAVGSGPLAKSGFSNMFGSTAGEIDGVDFSIPDSAKRTSEGAIQLKFGKRHYQQYGAFGRGTTLYCVDITKGDETILGVCKISWPAASRESEHDLIQQARTVDPNHLPEVVFSWDIEASDLPSRTLRSRCPQAALKYEPKVLRIVAFPFYAPIHELEGDEFLAAFWDVMLCTSHLILGDQPLTTFQVM
jgi:Fungal protein kinase